MVACIFVGTTGMHWLPTDWICGIYCKVMLTHWLPPVQLRMPLLSPQAQLCSREFSSTLNDNQSGSTTRAGFARQIGFTFNLDLFRGTLGALLVKQGRSFLRVHFRCTKLGPSCFVSGRVYIMLCLAAGPAQPFTVNVDINVCLSGRCVQNTL